jgi:hypothetical protein
MTCTHIKQIKKELKDFTEKFRNTDSLIYKKLDSIVNAKDIGAKVEVIEEAGWFSSEKRKAIATYKTSDFNYIAVEALEDLCRKIDSLLDECNCYEDLSGKLSKEKLEAKVKKDNIKTQSKAKDVMIIELSKSSASSESQVKSLTGDKSDLKNEVESLRNLTLDQRDKLTEYRGEITSLRKQLVQSVKQELDDLVQEYEIDKKEVEKLRQAHKQLARVCGVSEQSEIEKLESEVEKIEEELKKKIKSNKVRGVSEKCEQLAELNVKIEQNSNKDKEEKVKEEKVKEETKIIHVSPPRQ